MKLMLPNNVLLSIICVGAILIAGCTTSSIANPGIIGTWQCEDKEGRFIELDPDGTFYVSYGGSGLSGTWEVKGDKIRLISTLGWTPEVENHGSYLQYEDCRYFKVPAGTSSSSITNREYQNGDGLIVFFDNDGGEARLIQITGFDVSTDSYNFQLVENLDGRWSPINPKIYSIKRSVLEEKNNIRIDPVKK